MFVSSIKTWWSKKRVNSEGDLQEVVTTQPGQLKRAEEYETEEPSHSTVLSSCSAVLSNESYDSRVTIYYPENENEEVPQSARVPPSIQAYFYGPDEHPPFEDYSEDSSASECSGEQSWEGSEYEEFIENEEKENRDESVERYEEELCMRGAQGDVLDEILADDRPLFSDLSGEADDISPIRESVSLATILGSEKDCYGYEFDRLSEADLHTLRRRQKESLRSVGIDYTPNGPNHHNKRDSLAPAPPPHRGHDAHSVHSQSTSSNHTPAKPIPIDGVIGSAGYRNRVHMRDSASASPHSFVNRRSFQQLNNTAVYANLGGSFHEFPLSTSGDTRKPPIPQRSSIVSDSTLSSASPVVMRHAAPQYSSTPQNARRGLELQQNGYGGVRENARFSVAAPLYYEEAHHHQRYANPSSHRSSKAHRMSSSGGIAVTSASGQRGMVTSISHHDGYPNGGYTMEEYVEDHHSGGSGPSSFERDNHVRYLEERLRLVEQQLSGNAAAAAAAPPPAAPATPTFARSARHHAQSRVPPTPMDAAVLADKDAEISKLQRRLEQQQVQYEEEIRKLRTDTESVSGEHSVFKHKLERMTRELDEYRDKASKVDGAAIAAAATEKIEEKEAELSTVRAELERLKRDKELLEKRQEQIEFLQMQNETLNQKLDEKEGDVKTLEQQLVTLKLEHSMYQQSCSSGSTPMADDETRSLDAARTPQSNHHGVSGDRGDSASVGGGGQLARVRQYTKAHSTLGASGVAITPSSSSASPSISGTPKSTGLAKSLSNYHLDAAGTVRNELPNNLSVMLRKTQKLSVDSRSLAHCIRECAEKTMRGEQPDTSVLVGRMRESMSDSSDCEIVATDTTKMSMEVAEKTLRQQETALNKLHASLEGMRGLLLQVYQRRFHDEMERGDEACRVQ
ncbi:hypothetical protein PFISCL1PPCAC_2201 [Pristionchus fissidentatus]|uniref:Uncharacterized protein n=1 Tax=Pristionchus fissidentatus TaxID=1538716 RepID=A0AAV5UX36_9BILA|nr:hypothetical protein PFISCL1PPCAC_2201 [Pristionchus fissidentatus]